MDGKKTEPYGANPKGQFIFTVDGFFSTNIIRPDRPKFVSNNRTTGTPEENKAAVQGSNSTFGTYQISSDGSITLHIVGSTFPNWDGTKQTHLAAIKGDEIPGQIPLPQWAEIRPSHCNVRSPGSAILNVRRRNNKQASLASKQERHVAFSLVSG